MIELPFPPSSLSGHNNGAWYNKSRIVATHRAWAFHATKAAKPSVPQDGDIHICFRFVPPDRRGDRTNYPNRLKPYIDGIAEALRVNDRRFLPSYQFAEPEKPGRVEITFPQGKFQIFEMPLLVRDSEMLSINGLPSSEAA